jgi:hypothetical protein
MCTMNQFLEKQSSISALCNVGVIYCIVLYCIYSVFQISANVDAELVINQYKYTNYKSCLHGTL